MRPLKPLTVLRRLRKLFSDPNRFVRGALAECAAGYDVSATSEEAVRWCLLGAYMKEDPQEKSGAWLLLIRQAKVSPIRINDDHGYEAVLALLDRTIERAKGERTP